MKLRSRIFMAVVLLAAANFVCTGAIAYYIVKYPHVAKTTHQEFLRAVERGEQAGAVERVRKLHMDYIDFLADQNRDVVALTGVCAIITLANAIALSVLARRWKHENEAR